MRTNITFRYPAEFLAHEEYGEDVLAVRGAQWFADLLKRVPGLEVDEELCQEDWGVVVFARRNQKTFWIGLTPWDWITEGAWNAHFHHGSFSWLQWFSSTGKEEFKRLLIDVHDVLVSEPTITEIAWFEEREMNKPGPHSYPTPV
jgi:hypothetical protein